MSWKQRFGIDEPVVDPFNAPDPIMPGGEPDFGASETGDHADGVERIARRNERKEPGHWRHRAQLDHQPSIDAGTPLNEPAHTIHQQEGYRAPEEPARTYQPPRRMRRQRSAASQQETGRRKNRLGCVIALVIFFAIFTNVLGAFVSGCSALFDTLFTEDGASYNTPSDYDSASDYDDDAAYGGTGSYEAYDAARAAGTEAGAAALEETLQQMVDAEEPYLAIAIEGLDSTISSYTGVTAAELGIDTGELARTMLASCSFDIQQDPYVFPTETETGYDLELSGYFYLYVPDIDDAASQLSDFIWDHVPLGGSYQDALTDDVIAQAPAVFADALAASEPRDLYLSVDLTGTADAEGGNVQVALDMADWEDTFRSSVMGLY